METPLSSAAEVDMRPVPEKYVKWLRDKSNGLLVAASLIATMAFTTALTPPKGVWQETYSSRSIENNFNTRAGLSVLADTNSFSFSTLLCVNTVGFLCSINTIFLLITDLPRKNWRFFRMVAFSMYVACYSQAISYALIFGSIIPPDFELKGVPLQYIVMIVMSIFFIVQGISFLTASYCIPREETATHPTS